MGVNFEDREGATPIDPDEAEGLIPRLSTQAELNEFELLNIAEATAWAERSRKVRQGILSTEIVRLIHVRMFNKTWRWAGRFRKTQKSIGIEAYRIAPELHNLLEDVKIWLEFQTYPPAEVAARLHHRLVQIHPFANGNGRHARLVVDILCRREGWKLSDWGAFTLGPASATRSRYIECLRFADRGDIRPLIAFMAVAD